MKKSTKKKFKKFKKMIGGNSTYTVECTLSPNENLKLSKKKVQCKILSKVSSTKKKNNNVVNNSVIKAVEAEKLRKEAEAEKLRKEVEAEKLRKEAEAVETERLRVEAEKLRTEETEIKFNNGEIKIVINKTDNTITMNIENCNWYHLINNQYKAVKKPTNLIIIYNYQSKKIILKCQEKEIIITDTLIQDNINSILTPDKIGIVIGLIFINNDKDFITFNTDKDKNKNNFIYYINFLQTLIKNKKEPNNEVFNIENFIKKFEAYKIQKNLNNIAAKDAKATQVAKVAKDAQEKEKKEKKLANEKAKVNKKTQDLAENQKQFNVEKGKLKIDKTLITLITLITIINCDIYKYVKPKKSKGGHGGYYEKTFDNIQISIKYNYNLKQIILLLPNNKNIIMNTIYFEETDQFPKKNAIQLLNDNYDTIEFKNEEDKNNFILYINFLKQFISNTEPFNIDKFVRTFMDYKKKEIENKKKEIENNKKKIENFQYLLEVFNISRDDYDNIDTTINTYTNSSNMFAKLLSKEELKQLLLKLFKINKSISPKEQKDELKKKYREMAQQYHPDKSKNIETKNKNNFVFQFLNKINTLLNEILE